MEDRCRIKGYTLIEVLVALMILVLSLTVLLRIFSGGLRNIALAEDYARAVLVAEAQLASAGIDESLDVGRSYGEEQGQFRWTRIVDSYFPYQSDAQVTLPVSAFKITVVVEWPRSGRKHQIDLSSIQLIPHKKNAGGEI